MGSGAVNSCGVADWEWRGSILFRFPVIQFVAAAYTGVVVTTIVRVHSVHARTAAGGVVVVLLKLGRWKAVGWHRCTA